MKNSLHINLFAFAIAIAIHALLFLFREPTVKNRSASAKDTITLCFETASVKNEVSEVQKNPPRPEKPVKPERLPKKKPLKKKKAASSQKKPVPQQQAWPQNTVQKTEGVSESITSGTMARRMDTYLSRVHTKIERNKYYPRYSKRLNHQGISTVKLVIAPDGTILNITLASSSGYTTLDKAALDAIKKSAPLPPPSGYGLGKISLDIPLCYLLR